MTTSRRWCYTANNYTDDMQDKLRTCTCVYHVFGRETGDSGTPHLQGAICLSVMKRLSAMKKLLPTAHWEVMRGTAEEAATYCKKDGDFEEFGECPAANGGEGNKRRWDDAVAAAKVGDLDDIPADIYVKYYRTLKDIAKDHMVKPNDLDELPGVWIYGASGVGKSRKARADYPESYLKMQNKWWDGYQSEDSVILDDFDCKELGHLLKIWADRYSFVAETKGGAIHIRPKVFVITSNYSIDDLFLDEELRAALKRRFKVIHMINPFL